MTTNHPVDREEIMALADGELSPARAIEVRAHLESCAACQTIADDLRGVSTQLASWTTEPAPASLRVAAPEVAPAPRRSWWTTGASVPRWMLAAAAAAIVIGGTLIATRRSAIEDGFAVTSNGEMLSADSSSAKESLSDRIESRLKKTFNPPAQPLSEEKDKPFARRDANQAVVGGIVAQEAAPAVAAAKPETAMQNAPSDALMIVRTASISLSTDRFDELRARLEQAARVQGGSVGDLSVSGDPSTGRLLTATIRVPVANMDAAIAAVRGLGKMLSESQNAQDITDAHRDLTVRIANAKVEEARLGDILANRTGKLSDVLQVEQAQSRVRGEIEQMEAEEASDRGRAAMSTIGVQVSETPRAELAIGPLPISTRLRNALIDGTSAVVELLTALLLLIVSSAPMLVLIALVSAWPIRWMWKRVRVAFAR